MTKERSMKLFCNTCRQPTNHKVVRSYSDTYRREDNPEMPVDHAEGTWEIIQCVGCETISFRVLWLTSEHWATNEDPTEYRYPEVDRDRLDVKSFRQAPANIYRIYRESIQSFNIGSYILCAAGLRAVIEGICEETMPTKKKKALNKKIDDLHREGILSENHAEILHALRFIGNDAVHQLTAPPEDDLKSAIEILEHTIENLYVFSEKGQRLLRKKQRN